jgi:hypothetical protein
MDIEAKVKEIESELRESLAKNGEDDSANKRRLSDLEAKLPAVDALSRAVTDFKSELIDIESSYKKLKQRFVYITVASSLVGVFCGFVFTQIPDLLLVSASTRSTEALRSADFAKTKSEAAEKTALDGLEQANKALKATEALSGLSDRIGALTTAANNAEAAIRSGKPVIEEFTSLLKGGVLNVDKMHVKHLQVDKISGGSADFTHLSSDYDTVRDWLKSDKLFLNSRPVSSQLDRKVGSGEETVPVMVYVPKKEQEKPKDKTKNK